jgi:hypothetical protein
MLLNDTRLPPRFWSKVEVCRETGCWLWTASLGSGYGQFMLNGMPVRAHRVAYEALIGPVPRHLQCDHLCRVRRCVNPAHLEIVTSGENTRRGNAGKARGAQLRARTHCPHGHPFSGENLVVGAKQRFCRECRRVAAREYQRRKRLQVL